MKIIPLVFVSIALLSPLTIQAQDDTAHHRALYAEINAVQKKLEKVNANYEEEPLVFDLQAYKEGEQIRKILVKVPGEDGDGAEEYYLENEKPAFVFRRYFTADPDGGKTQIDNEDRFYFNDGKMFKWLDSQKKSVSPGSSDFALESERLLVNLENFLAVLKAKADAPQVSSTQVVEGIFSGIEEGDYSHWLMKSTNGKDLSFFILQTDDKIEAVLENPKKFIGKKCRISWKQSVEEIPEAGGKLKIEQLLTVEWLK